MQKINPSVYPSFSVTYGRANVYERIASIFTESTALIYISCTVDEMLRMFKTGIPDRINSYRRMGGRVRILMEPCDDEMILLANQLGADEIMVTKIPFKGRMLVQENTQAIVSTSMADSIHIDETNDSIVHTTYHDIVGGMFNLCDHLWNTAKRDVKQVIL